MNILFIRHGKTAGNLEKRYIGTTDEELCKEVIHELESRYYPNVTTVVCSPMKRCIQTAKIIFPDKPILIEENLRECNFGDFEGKNYSELCNDARYLKWLDSMGTLPFPNGEPHEDFVNRCIAAFENAVSKLSSVESAAFVVHGGTIMAVLERFAVPKKSFYDYQVKNGCGYLCRYESGKIEIVEEIL